MQPPPETLLSMSFTSLEGPTNPDLPASWPPSPIPFMALPITTRLSPAALCSSSRLTSFVWVHPPDAYSSNITFPDSFSKALSHFLSREDTLPSLPVSLNSAGASTEYTVGSYPTYYAQGPFKTRKHTATIQIQMVQKDHVAVLPCLEICAIWEDETGWEWFQEPNLNHVAQGICF